MSISSNPPEFTQQDHLDLIEIIAFSRMQEQITAQADLIRQS